MVRSTVALAGLAILATFASPPATASAVAPDPDPYTVVDGDTLWDLAGRFLGDPGQWTRIFDANRDRISNPSLLPRGVELDIPAEVPGALLDVMVTSPGGETTALTVATPPAPQEARGPKPLSRRTVFWPDTSGTGIILDGNRISGPPMPEDVFFGSPWLLTRGDELGGLGEVSSFAGALELRAVRSSARPHDQIRITFDNGVPAVGAKLRAYRVTRSITGVGDVVTPTGVLTVLSVDAEGALASVDKIYDRLMVGDRLESLPSFPFRDGQQAMPLSGGPEATVVGFQVPHELQSPGDVVFLDLGSDDGVQLGDVFEVIWPGADSDTAEGTAQVVTVRPGTAGARIRFLKNPVFTRGVQVRLVRRLQQQ